MPLIGVLFGSQSKSETRARFFVFLRCKVMRASGLEDLKYASQKDLGNAAVDDGQRVTSSCPMSVIGISPFHAANIRT